MATTDLVPGDNAEVTFPVTGMTCASCVRRIEKALGRVDGVQEATVNLASEKAHVVYDPQVASPEHMRAAVEKAGYTMGAMPERSAPELTAAPEDAQDIERQREIDDLKRKWMVSLTVGVLMMALTYAPLDVPMDVLAPL